MCKINGISNRWLEQIKRILTHYLDYVEWEIDEDNTINYLEHIINSSSVSYFRKRVYQIRKYLTYLNIEWANNINPPNEPMYYPKRIKNEDIKKTLEYFAENPYYKQLRAIIYLGMTTGMRAEELYQLEIDDVNLDNRIVHINHNPSIGQTTKTKISRISFFTNEVKEIFEDYLTYFNNERLLK